MMRKALVVGINDYPSNPLHGCVNDAEKISSLLETHSDGSHNFDVKLITQPKTSVTKAVLKQSLETLFCDDCEIALFYFSGHGLVTSCGGCIMTTDYRKYDEGISMHDILLLANKSKVKDRIIILDCCHSGTFGTLTATCDSTSHIAEGLSVIAASRDFEAAMEENGAGIFTALVADALEGGAADLRGNITPSSIYAYVDKALGAWDQRPVFKTNVTHLTSIRKAEPPVPLSVLRKICEYFPDPQNDHPLDPSYEFTDTQATEENVAIFKDLQKFESAGLVKPVDEEHMYFAAMNSKSCRLTTLGYQAWRMVKEKRI